MGLGFLAFSLALAIISMKLILGLGGTDEEEDLDEECLLSEEPCLLLTWLILSVDEFVFHEMPSSSGSSITPDYKQTKN